MRRFFHRQQGQGEEFILETPDFEALAKNAVTDLRHRLHEDPEFTQSFGDFLRSLRARQREESGKDSKEHNAAYGDTPETYVSDDVHALRGTAFREIVSLLYGLATAGEDETDPAPTLDGIRSILGELTAQVYFEAQTEPPLQLRDGALGVKYIDFDGTVVVWERVRGYESELDKLAGQ